MKLSRRALIISAISLLITLALLLDVTPYLRGGFGWRWPYALMSLSAIFPLCLGVAIYLLLAWWLIRRSRRAFPVLMLSFLGAIIIPILAVAARDGDPFYALFTRTTALLGTGQHWASTHVDWAGGEWRSWTEVMQRLGGHMTNVPPGAPLIFHIIDVLSPPQVSVNLQRLFLPYQCQNFDLLAYAPGQWASALFGMLMPVWGALTVFPLYASAKRLTKADARLTAVWWALVPAAASFTPSWSVLNPFLTVTAFWLLLIGFERKRGFIWFFASGLLSGIALFINLALIPVPMFMGLYTLFHYGTKDFKKAVVTGILYGVGLLIPWLLFWLAGGQTFFDLMRTSMQFHLSLDRPYWFWVWMHIWDWVMWTGIVLAILWIRTIWIWWRNRKTAEFPLLAVTLLLTMLILTISGTARGETGRVWLFFSPFMVIAAVDGLRTFTDSQRDSWPIITVVQAVLFIVVIACLDVVGTNFSVPPSAPQTTVSHDVDATFGTDAFKLTGWDSQYQNGQLNLHLRWQGLSQVTTPYWFTAVLVAPDGQTTSIEPWQPGSETRYPTTCWVSGQTIGDEVSLPLPAAPQKGNWWVSLAVYGDKNAPDGRLAVTQPGQAADTQVGLGPINVP